MHFLFDKISEKLPSNIKSTNSNWISFNGPCCIHNGERRPDSRKRAGIKIEADGSLIYNCFNCSFKAGWKPGNVISKKMQSLLYWFGFSDLEIKRLVLYAWQSKNDDLPENKNISRIKYLNFTEIQLPSHMKPFSHWIDNPTDDFVEVLDTLIKTRGDDIYGSYDYYWSPLKKDDLNRRITIPFRWNNKIVGWTSRAIFNTKFKYITNVPPNYIFNTEVIKPEHKFIILVEGPFDAISCNGIACLGNKLNDSQINWLNNTGKNIILLPDRDTRSYNLIDIAVKNDWYVSFPKWSDNIKDASDAFKEYGKLYTMWSIIDNKTKNKLQINVEKRLMING